MFCSQVLSGRIQLLMECNRKSKQAPGFSAFPQNMTGVQIESCGLEVPGTPQTQQVPTLGHVVANPSYGACAIWRRWNEFLNQLVEKGVWPQQLLTGSVWPLKKALGVVTGHFSHWLSCRVQLYDMITKVNINCWDLRQCSKVSSAGSVPMGFRRTTPRVYFTPFSSS